MHLCTVNSMLRRRSPPNSPQKLARPGFGPAAEPPRNVKNNTASRGAHSRASHAGAPRAALASVTRALAVQLSV